VLVSTSTRVSPRSLERCESSRTRCSCHLGSVTLESRTAMGVLTLENLQAFLEGQEPPCRDRSPKRRPRSAA
jgi:lactate dehydrogenase-like 2-hydroxyacid dehydrogenase